jgi:hypothetical protein
MGLTLVACYGDKSPELNSLVQRMQEKLSSLLSSSFYAYDVEQVHATIIGLEGFRRGGEILNQKYWELRGKERPMDLSQVLKLLHKTPKIPLKIRIGGFRPDRDYPFRSRGQHPYFRSFTIQDRIAVAMGWPAEDNCYPLTLEDLRRDFNSCNVLHKFHISKDVVDNDFYFVLGRIDRESLNEDELQKIQAVARQGLAQMEPVVVIVDRKALSLVCYLDDQLPKSTSQEISLSEAVLNLDRIMRLY